MTYQEEIAQIKTDKERIRKIREQFENDMRCYNPDIHRDSREPYPEKPCTS